LVGFGNSALAMARRARGLGCAVVGDPAQPGRCPRCGVAEVGVELGRSGEQYLPKQTTSRCICR
jgi:hypothetical protein